MGYILTAGIVIIILMVMKRRKGSCGTCKYSMGVDGSWCYCRVLDSNKKVNGWCVHYEKEK